MINSNQYQSVADIAEKWRISPRRVRLLCATKRILGAIQEDGNWFVPRHVDKPADKRATRYQSWPKELDRPIRNMEAARAKALHLIRTQGAVKPRQRNRERDEFIREAAIHTHRDTEGSLSPDEISEILHDRAAAGKSVREQMDVQHVKTTIQFIIDKIQEQSPLTISLIKQIHSCLACGRPQGDTALRDDEFSDQAHKALATMLATYKSSRSHISQRIAAFMLAFLDEEPFEHRNFQTAAMTANFMLLSCEYAPMTFAKYSMRQCLNDYRENEDAIPLARYIANANVEASKKWPSQLILKRK